MTQRVEKNLTFIRIFSQKVVTLPYQIILCLAQEKNKPTNNCNIMETLREIIHSIQQNKVRNCLGEEIDLRLDDIARSISLRPETVSRTFTTFERKGLVARLGRGRIQIVNHQGLRDVSTSIE